MKVDYWHFTHNS